MANANRLPARGVALMKIGSPLPHQPGAPVYNRTITTRDNIPPRIIRIMRSFKSLNMNILNIKTIF